MEFKDSLKIIETLKRKINNLDFMRAHRNSDRDFTRERKLPFVSLVLFMLNLVRDTLQKELTNFLTRFSDVNGSPQKISKSAFCQSRVKLKPEAFVELNHTLVHEFYTDNEYETWRGFRLLSVDGTTLQLPYSDKIRNYFGYNNDPYERKLPMARSSSLYDLCNDVIINTKIDSYYTGEYELFLSHVDKINLKDLLILDRGYGAIWLFFLILSKKADFVVRLQSNFSTEIDLFLESNENSRIVHVTNSTTKSKQALEKLSLDFKPFEYRLIKVVLDNGEIEILATSLMDEDKFPVEIFKDLYFMRWGIEVNIDHLKNQVEIENFTGLTPISVEQDYYANMFITNLQAIIARDAKAEVDREDRGGKYEYKINKNLSLGYMKDRIVNILMGDNPKYFEELKELFKIEQVPVRKNRRFERNPYRKRKKYFINKRRAL